MAHEIVLNQGDDVTEQAIRLLLGREAISGYIESGGVGVDYYSSDDTVDVESGTVHILDNLADITLNTDAFVAHSLVADAVNHLWIAVDPTVEDDDAAVSLVSNATGTAPANPSIEIATVDTTQTGTQAVDLLNRDTAAALEGSSVNLGGLSLFGNALQSSLDGYVVAVAPGVGLNEAYHEEDTTTPVRDAVSAVEDVGVAVSANYGAGEVLLPPGITETPGGIAALGGKAIRGHGIQSSVIDVTDPTTSGFALGGEGSNRQHTYLDGFAITGGDRAARTAGSAISAEETSSDTLTAQQTGNGFNIGQLLFRRWGGPDPVINGHGSFSNQWEHLRALRYDGALFRGGGFDTNFGFVNANHSSFDTPVIDIDGNGGPVYLPSLNIGGNVGRGLRLDKSFSRHAAFHGGHINIEPDADGGGTLTSAPAPIELLGASPASIASVSQDDRLTSNYTVALAGSEEYVGQFNDGAGRNEIGPITYADAVEFNKIGVTGDVEAPSWYWGGRSDIDYGGKNWSAVVPINDLNMTERTAFGTTLNGTSIPTGEWTQVGFLDTPYRYGPPNAVTASGNGWIAPETGIYRLVAMLQYNVGPPDAAFALRYLVDGTTQDQSPATAGGALGFTAVTASWTVSLNAAEAVTLETYHNVGASANVTTESRFSAERIR